LQSLTEKQVLYLLAQFALLVFTARLLADLMRRLGQATVIGELLAGLVLGQSVLGHFFPGAFRFIFPGDPIGAHLLEGLAWVGVIMLLLCTGLETELDILRGMGRVAALVSAFGIVIPLAGGFALGWWMPAAYLAAPNGRLIFSLFLAIAMAISAVPVIAKILMDLDLLRRELGLLILAAGILDDSIGWLLLSIVAGLAARGTIDLHGLLIILAYTGAFIAFCYFAGFRLVAEIVRFVDDHSVVEHATLTTMIAIAFGCAVVTQAIGIHAVFGGFVAGVMLRGSARTRKIDRDQLQAVTMGVLAPLFFAYSGLKTDIFSMTGLAIPLLVLGVACAGKLVGCTLGGIIGGLQLREAFAVSTGMNARGGMEIVVALLGLSLGILTQQMYTVIVLVAIVTSMITPPLLGWALSEVPERASEAERDNRERLRALMPFSHEGAKLLVVDGGGPHTQLATHLAAALGTHEDATITILQLPRDNANGSEKADLNLRFANLKMIADLCGVGHVIQRTAVGESMAEAIVEEAHRSYDAIFVGVSAVEGEELLDDPVALEVLRDSPAPVVIARYVAGGVVPFKRVIAPVTGAAYSRRGAAVAMLYAQAIDTQLTALYVMENPEARFPGMLRGIRLARTGQQIVDEIKLLGTELDLAIDGQVGAGRKPEAVILNAVETGKFDLLIMGVLYRSVEQRLYFGPKVDRILRDSNCSVAIVVSPGKTASGETL
jgi:Kef-type K+ transport system membrane component KefB/nucleotide-binding universal stress UspA family protein